MANKRLLLRRGDSAAHSTFTGVEGEITYVTDSKELRLHDGVTAGGTSFTSGKPPAGAAGAIQSTDGSGEFTDSGLTITSSTLTSAISFAKSLTIGSSQSPVENLFMNNADIGGLTLQVVGNKLQLDGEDILRSSDLVSSSTISAGTIRISTSAESTTGTDDSTAMTPLKVKTVVDASVNAALTGGVQYQGTFDPSSPDDLSNALKGDLYIISGTAATYQGQSWALGDHLLVNDDMGGTLDSAKIDKVDNTDAVTSVNGDVGTVSVDLDSVLSRGSTSSTGITLQTGATITNMLPGTVLTGKILTSSGNLQLQGTNTGIVEVLGTDSIPGAIKINCEQNSHGITIKSPEHSAGASYTLTLPTAQASDGQFLQSTANGTLSWGTASTATAISELTDVDLTATTLSAGQVLTYDDTDNEWKNTTLNLSADNFNVQTVGTETVINDPGKGSLWVYYFNSSNRTMTLPTADSSNAGGIIKVTNGNASSILQLSGSLVFVHSGGAGGSYTMIPRTTITLISNGTGWNLVSVEEDKLNGLSDVDVTGAVATNVLKYDGTNWVDDSVAYSEVTGTPTLATVATTGAYSDLSGAPDVPTLENNFVTTTSTATAISENGHYAYWFNNTSSITLTLPAQDAGVVSYLTFTNINSVDHSVSLGSGSFRLSGGATATSITIPAGNTRSFYYNSATYWELSSNELNELGDVSAASPNDGDVLAYNSTSGAWEATAQSGGGGSAPVIYRTGDTYGTTTIPSTGTFGPVLYAAGVVGLEEIFILNPTGNMNFLVFDANHTSVSNGFKYNIKNISSSSSVTVKTNINGSSTIDDYAIGSGITLSQNASVTLVADKDNNKWYII